MSDELTPRAILKQLEAHLQDFVKRNGGRLDVAASEAHAFVILANAPTGWNCILNYGGDENVGEWDSGQANATIEVIVQQAAGLDVRPGANLWDSVGGRMPLFEIASRVRARLRTASPTGGEQGDTLEYRGWDKLALPDGTPLPAVRLRFAIQVAIPTEEEQQS